MSVPTMLVLSREKAEQDSFKVSHLIWFWIFRDKILVSQDEKVVGYDESNNELKDKEEEEKTIDKV